LRRRANGPRATNSREATPTPLSPVKAWRRRHNPSIHLDNALRRWLPVALVRWARRPSEGPALLGWLREFPSSATPEHPSSPVKSPRNMRFGDLTSNGTGHRPSLECTPAKGYTVLRTRVPFTVNIPALSNFFCCAVHADDSSCPVAGTVSPHAAPRKEHCEAVHHRSRWRITSLGF